MANEDYGWNRGWGDRYARQGRERDYGREGWGRDDVREERSERTRGAGPDFTWEEWRGRDPERKYGAGYGRDYPGGLYRGSPYDEPDYAGDQWGGYRGYRGAGGAYGYEGLTFGGERERESYAGRGPKGYKRSDERITDDVNDRLTWHPDIDASNIEVRVENGEVTLSGTVDTRRTKRLAEDVVENVPGVTDVRNEVRVSRGGAQVTSERETAVTTNREGRSPREGTETRRATRSSTTASPTRS